jgi:hypothetical protein
MPSVMAPSTQYVPDLAAEAARSAHPRRDLRIEQPENRRPRRSGGLH